MKSIVTAKMILVPNHNSAKSCLTIGQWSSKYLIPAAILLMHRRLGKNVFSPPIECPEMIITNLVAVLVREAVEFKDLRLLGPGPALLRDLH